MDHDPRKLGNPSVSKYSGIQLAAYFLLISSRKGSKLTLALPSKRTRQVCFSYLACNRSSIRMFCVATLLVVPSIVDSRTSVKTPTESEETLM